MSFGGLPGALASVVSQFMGFFGRKLENTQEEVSTSESDVSVVPVPEVVSDAEEKEVDADPVVPPPPLFVPNTTGSIVFERQPSARLCKESCTFDCRKSQDLVERKRLEMLALLNHDKKLHLRSVQALVFVGLREDFEAEYARKKGDTPRHRQRFDYQLGPSIGRVCRQTFMYATATSESKLQRIQAHVATAGMSELTDKRLGKPPGWYSSAPFLGKVHDLHQWMTEYINTHALSMPTRLIFRRNGAATHVLPAALTLQAMYQAYTSAVASEFNAPPDAAVAAGAPVTVYKPMSWGFFRQTFKNEFQWCSLGLKRSDICDTCHAHTYLLNRVTSEKELEDRQAFLTAHLTSAKAKRDLYNADLERYSGMAACFALLTVMLCMDFAQNTTLPHFADQPGKIFFKTPFRIQLFGVFVSSLLAMDTFFIPENVSNRVGRGHECVIGILYSLFQRLEVFDPANPAVKRRPDHIDLGRQLCRSEQE